MELDINPEPPEIMHIDLNSAFAMTEQQANPLLRGRPVGITNRLNDWAICITASYEAKRRGIGIGTRWREARMLAPNFTMIESDPAKYQYVHRQLRAIFESYSPVAYMKSIDEGVIDFRGMRRLLKGRTMEDIGREIKQRVRDEIGDYMSLNVGIGQNRWLAKVAASFMKPDGLYSIDKHNLELVYSMMDLMDLPYIKARNRARLHNVGIQTPLDFLRSSESVLVKQVFKSINGHHWYLKLRGYETEVEYGIKTVGRSYVLEHRTADPEELAALFYKTSVKLSRRMKKNDLAARGLMLSLRYVRQPSQDSAGHFKGNGWYRRQMWPIAVHRADQIQHRLLTLFSESPPGRVVSQLAVTAYGVEPARRSQPSLFEDHETRRDRIEQAMHTINDRYGELSMVPASALASKNPMKDKIPFGTIRYFD